MAIKIDLDIKEKNKKISLIKDYSIFAGVESNLQQQLHEIKDLSSSSSQKKVTNLK